MTKEQIDILKDAVIELTIKKQELIKSLNSEKENSEMRWKWYQEAKEEIDLLNSKEQKGIVFNGHEKQSNYNRVKNAEQLILQLPQQHEGRNTWLLNYGIGSLSKLLREKKSLKWDDETQSCETIK